MRIHSITELFGGPQSLAQFMADSHEVAELQNRWRTERDTPARWQIIRRMYALKFPRIEARGLVNPYFLDWDFTPIEFDAWQDIRLWMLPIYPQYPVSNCFIDFADPVKKIGIELDGAAFHVESKDRARDTRLWNQGWRIFRAPGSQCRKAPWQPFSPEWHEELREDPHGARAKLFHWARNYSEGMIWALSVFYYGDRSHGRYHQEYFDIAEASLDCHRYESFPLTDEQEE